MIIRIDVYLVAFLIGSLLPVALTVQVLLKNRLSAIRSALQEYGPNINETVAEVYSEVLATSILLRSMLELHKHRMGEDWVWDKVHPQESAFMLINGCNDAPSVLTPLVSFRSSRKLYIYCGEGQKVHLAEPIRFALAKLEYHYQLRPGDSEEAKRLVSDETYAVMQVSGALDPFTDKVAKKSKELAEFGIMYGKLSSEYSIESASESGRQTCSSSMSVAPIIVSGRTVYYVKAEMHSMAFFILTRVNFQHFFTSAISIHHCGRAWRILLLPPREFVDYDYEDIFAEVESIASLELSWLAEFRHLKKLGSENEFIPCKFSRADDFDSLSQEQELHWKRVSESDPTLKLTSDHCNLEHLDRVRILSGLKHRSIGKIDTNALKPFFRILNPLCDCIYSPCWRQRYPISVLEPCILLENGKVAFD
jgi:hypothetical protein